MLKTGDLGETVAARLPAGTGARIESILADQETASDFFRDAVERELQRREAARAEVERAAKLLDVQNMIRTASIAIARRLRQSLKELMLASHQHIAHLGGEHGVLRRQNNGWPM
jgi:hypothetical protein